MESIVWYLENLKNGSPDHDFVIDDALHHIQLAREAIDEGLKNPREWRERAELTARTLARGLPFMWALQQTLTERTDSNRPE